MPLAPRARRRRTLRRALSPVAATVALALLLTACAAEGSEQSVSDAAASSEQATPSDDAAPTEPTAPADGAQYVALGDSYTSAPLVPSTDTADGCLQSTGNYPHLLAASLGYSLSDVSCAGATTASLIGVQQLPTGDTAPAQFDALAKDTELVTVSVGANDEGLFSTLVRSCFTLGQDDPTGSPCTDQLTDELVRQAADLEERTESVVTGIRGRSPQAEIVVVTYPQLVPPSGTCEAIPIAQGDYPLAREVNRALSDALAAGARAGGARVLDVFRLSRGHDLCSDDPWVNGPRTDPGAALAFHPFAAEQQAVAAALEKLVG